MVTLRVYAEKQPVYVDPAEVSNGESLGRGVWEGGIARSSVAGPALCYQSTSARGCRECCVSFLVGVSDIRVGWVTIHEGRAVGSPDRRGRRGGQSE